MVWCYCVVVVAAVFGSKATKARLVETIRDDDDDVRRWINPLRPQGPGRRTDERTQGQKDRKEEIKDRKEACVSREEREEECVYIPQIPL